MKFNQDGLIPAIIQDSSTRTVLMLGYMNAEAFELTKQTKKVTFFSRSKNRIWVKGESSGNFLTLVDWKLDCDQDALLISARPAGPTCHTGSDTCWSESNTSTPSIFLDHLQQIIDDRYANPNEQSYTTSLFNKGTNKIAQKVGEEAVELVIESKDDNDDLFLGEAADLMFHYMVLLKDRGMGLKDVVKVLEGRHIKK